MTDRELLQQEPVAWFINSNSENDQPPHYEQVADQFNGIGDSFPLYIAPQPDAQPVPLTDEQLKIMATYCREHITDADFINIARAIEAAHGIGSKP